jgi:hypothetical protein
MALLELGRRARHTRSSDELAFLLVNGTHGLTPYRQAALWWADTGIQTLSGVVQAEQNAPYVDWLRTFMAHQLPAAAGPTRVAVQDLPQPLQGSWADWLPAHGLVLPLNGPRLGGLLLARDQGWTDTDLALLNEWTQTWLHAWQAVQPRHAHRQWLHWSAWKNWLGLGAQNRPWYRRKILALLLALLALLFLPVRMTVLAQGELVPAQPVVVRSPIEGVIAKFHAPPNAQVQTGQPLFEFDPVLIETRAKVAEQALVTALAEYRQTSQLSLADPKYKSELARLAGSIEEKRSEFDYLKEQRKRSVVLATDAGTLLYDDPSTWTGKPVAVGERIMRIARTGDVEVEVWLPMADAVELQLGDPVTLYLLSDPLQPVTARLRYFSHEATLRPDGVYAYRIRATLEEKNPPRVGLKGTAKLTGRWTVLSYWLLRRPLAVVRTTLGI